MRRLMSRATADEDESAIDITPMLDVVFIMLIFFIVTATFIKEAGIDVNRPDAATAVKQEKANILIAINANNEIWIDRRQVDIRSVRPARLRCYPGRQGIENRDTDQSDGCRPFGRCIQRRDRRAGTLTQAL